MQKNYLSLILLISAINFGFSQVLTESFNDDSGFTKSESFFTDNSDDYFGIYDPTGTSDDFDGSPTPPVGLPLYTGNTNLFLVGEDLDGNAGSATRTLTWSNLNISGYTGLNLSVDLAADSGGFDAADSILFEVNIDGSGYTTIIAFSGTGNNTNATNGTITLNTAFQTVTANIVGTGNLLDLRLTITADADGEEFAVDEIILDGTPPVPCAHSITSFAPTEGPEDTEVTISGTGFTASSTVAFNGVAASSIRFINSSTLVAVVPSGTTTGALSVTESACTETSSDFTIIDLSGSCSSPFSDLIISEVYDSGSGSLGYIEIYNGTGASIDLSNYEIDRYATLGGGVSFTYTFPTLNINDGQVLIGKVSSDPDAPGVTPDFTFGNTSGFNDDDRLELVLSATNTVVDDWHDDTVPGGAGFSYLRNTTITGPNPNYNASEWTGNGTEDTSDLGNYSISVTGNPSITSQPTSVIGCNVNSINLSITAAPGNSGTLTYQWRFNDGSTSTWQDVNGTTLASATVSGETTNTLSVSGIDLEGYQFYCVVTEDASCSVASNAVNVSNTTVTWDGTNWTWSDGTAIDTPPTLSENVVLNANFNTTNGGLQQSFDACSLTINDTFTLTIGNGTYVQVEHNLTVNNATSGGINIEPEGSFVQIDDNGSVSASTPEDLTVSKITAPADNWYEYTYWSSPVENESISDALGISNPNRRYWFNAQNYLDTYAESGNDNSTGPGNEGQDDVDDDNNDWQQITNTSTPINNASLLEPGVGYATTHNPAAFSCTPGPGCPDPRPGVRYTFAGLFNNGIIDPTIYRNDAELNDNNWNLIGNPYPSAIIVNGPNGFLTQNTSVIDGNVTGGAIDGAIFIWSQSTPPVDSNNGNQNINFAQSDYAIINAMGSVAGGDANGDGVIDTSDRPGDYIPSGQAFFVSMSDSSPAYDGNPTIKSSTITFNNAMRVTGNNDLFFRTSNSINKLGISLTSDNGVASEVLIGYSQNASDDYDGMYYDAPKNESVDINSVIYTSIPNMDKQFAIQSKNSNSLTIDEVIPVGFYTEIDEPTIYSLSISQREGDFMTSNTIYLIDRLDNSIHELDDDTNYDFVSDSGEFDDRFEIVFTAQALSIDDNNVNPNQLTITELSNGDVQIKITEPLTIKTVEILDILGRQIYNLEGTSSTELYNLSKLSNAAYIAKVTLSNGQTISKKAIKQH